jgi:hypothetical protein
MVSVLVVAARSHKRKHTFMAVSIDPGSLSLFAIEATIEAAISQADVVQKAALSPTFNNGC